MRAYRLSGIVVCTLLLCGAAVAASAAPVARQPVARQAMALWLSRQLQRPVEAAELLVSPQAAELESCTLGRARPAPTGATALSLRCPGPALPQLVLLKLPFAAVSDRAVDGGFTPLSTASTKARQPATAVASRLPKVPPLVRAGATVEADWRMAALHAQLPVVALDSGASGAEIRVRIAESSRILRARILSAHRVSIVEAGG